MATESHMTESVKHRKRKVGHKKGYNGKKQQKQFPEMKERVKMDPKFKKMLQKKARDYNSDDDEEEEEIKDDIEEEHEVSLMDDDDDGDKDFDIEGEGSEHEEDDVEEGGEMQPGITKLVEGCRAFGIAFKSIMAKTVPDDSLGPVLSGHQKLVVEKLAEEETGNKVKREAKKEKRLMEEKGHVKPANYLDTHEKFLISLATKGVVKLFNAVNKAQNAQKGLDPSRTKDAKVIKNRRKQAFFSELSKTSSANEVKVNSEGPSWAPLRDNYMLTNSRLKDWDKKQDTVAADDIGKMSEDSGSDD